jgi:hypothetical protein
VGAVVMMGCSGRRLWNLELWPATFRICLGASSLPEAGFYRFKVDSTLTAVVFFFFFLVSWGGVRLSPLGTSAANWPIVPVPDDM